MDITECLIACEVPVRLARCPRFGIRLRTAAVVGASDSAVSGPLAGPADRSAKEHCNWVIGASVPGPSGSRPRHKSGLGSSAKATSRRLMWRELFARQGGIQWEGAPPFRDISRRALWGQSGVQTSSSMPSGSRKNRDQVLPRRWMSPRSAPAVTSLSRTSSRVPRDVTARP